MKSQSLKMVEETRVPLGGKYPLPQVTGYFFTHPCNRGDVFGGMIRGSKEPPTYAKHLHNRHALIFFILTTPFLNAKILNLNQNYNLHSETSDDWGEAVISCISKS